MSNADVDLIAAILDSDRDSSSMSDLFRDTPAFVLPTRGSGSLGTLSSVWLNFKSFFVGLGYYLWSPTESNLKRRLAASLRVGLLSIFPAVFFLALFIYGKKRDQSEGFIESAKHLQLQGDYRTAELLYRKGKVNHPTTPSVDFELAMCLSKLGKESEAEEILEPMYNSPSNGFAKAHFWKGRSLAQRAGSDSVLLQEALTQYQRGLNLDITNLEAIEEAGRLYIKLGYVDVGAEHLVRASSVRPQLKLEAAEAHYRNGDKNYGEDLARQVAHYFDRIVPRTPKDIEILVCGARAHLLFRDFRGAETLLRKALLLPTGKQVAPLLASVYGEWAQSLKLISLSNVETRLELISQGLQFDPKNPELLEALLEMTAERTAKDEKGSGFISSLFAKGENSDIRHLLQGINAFDRGDMSKAQVHLNQSFFPTNSSRVPEMLGGLIELRASKSAEGAKKSLELANLAISLQPSNSPLFTARSNVHVLLNNPQNALNDARVALRVAPDSIELRKNLAKIYRMLGDETKAAEQERLIKEFEKSSSKDNSKRG